MRQTRIRWRVPDAAIRQVLKYGGAHVGFPSRNPVLDRSGSRFSSLRSALLLETDWRGLVFDQREIGSWMGGYLYVTVGLSLERAAAWDERGEGFIPASFFDRWLRPDQKWMFELEPTGGRR